MRPIIKVEGLGKEYRVGGAQAAYSTLREAVSDAVMRPLGRLRGRGEGGPARGDGDRFWALKDVTFDVMPGEVVGIVGRNGAGKSTLLKILSRITEPSEGRVELYGRVGSLLEVGTGFHPELTGRENIFLNGAILGMRKAEIERKFDEIVRFAEIERFIDTPVKRYSSGMYVRLAFAVAAHLEPEILIVDEVLAVGDAAFQKKCLGKMGEVARGGRTVLFVSHNMGAVNQLCTRAVHVAGGRVKDIGPTRQVVTDYLSELFRGGGEDLEELRQLRTGAGVRFRRIELASADGATVPFDRPVEYLLDVESDVDMEGLSIGSTVFSVTTGHSVGSLITREKFDVEAGRRVRLRLRVSGANLAPGSYYAGFSIGRGGDAGARTDFDAVVGRPAFQVLPLSDESDPVANWHPSWGDVVFRDTQLSVEEA
ncbi:MAG TPA: ABC transporter ATP-binding protein [Pyrinomonadaceae bacterium]|nr:ABC transporter ATP-binding protein [Pyrinomonadaceae bacterium]